MKKRITYSIVVALLYIAIYFVCYQFFFIGREFHLYTPDWTAKNILLFAAIISVVPAFFGYKLFSFITLYGYVLGIIFGELFGQTMKHSMPYHYGWLICIVFYLFACLIGFVAEKVIKIKQKQ